MPKYGDINSATNLVFVQRGRTYPNGEYWVTHEVFNKRKKWHRMKISQESREKEVSKAGVVLKQKKGELIGINKT